MHFHAIPHMTMWPGSSRTPTRTRGQDRTKKTNLFGPLNRCLFRTIIHLSLSLSLSLCVCVCVCLSVSLLAPSPCSSPTSASIGITIQGPCGKDARNARKHARAAARERKTTKPAYRPEGGRIGHTGTSRPLEIIVIVIIIIVVVVVVILPFIFGRVFRSALETLLVLLSREHRPHGAAQRAL